LDKNLVLGLYLFQSINFLKFQIKILNSKSIFHSKNIGTKEEREREKVMTKLFFWIRWKNSIVSKLFEYMHLVSSGEGVGVLVVTRVVFLFRHCYLRGIWGIFQNGLMTLYLRLPKLSGDLCWKTHSGKTGGWSLIPCSQLNWASHNSTSPE
jgi:hypothetical protein